MYFFNGKTIETKKIQITEIDQMIMFYNTMWLIIPHSCIWGLFGGQFLQFYRQILNGQKTAEYENEKLLTT